MLQNMGETKDSWKQWKEQNQWKGKTEIQTQKENFEKITVGSHCDAGNLTMICESGALESVTIWQ